MTSSLFDLTGRTAVVVGGYHGHRARAGVGARRRRRRRRRHRSTRRRGRGGRIGDRVARAAHAAAPADVGELSSLHRLRDACLSAFGHVDIVVAAAGITRRTATLDLAEAEWNQILDTNVTGMFRTYQTFAPSMIARGAGRLIGMASLASFVGLQEVAAYTASKAAVAGLTRALAVEWSRHGVTVNAIAPGVFETDLNREILKGARGQEFLLRTPMARFGRVEELVGAAVYLASDASTFVTGQLVAVDGGFLASGVNQ